MRTRFFFLVLFLVATASGCTPPEPPPKVTANYLAGTSPPSETLTTLEKSRTELQALYREDGQRKDWSSANNIAARLLNCLENQNLLKQQVVQFTPVTTKKEALGWAELAYKRCSEPPKNSIPGTHDPEAARATVAHVLNAIKATEEER